MFGDEDALAALGVGGFQHVDLGIVGEQGAAPRSDDADGHQRSERALALVPNTRVNPVAAPHQVTAGTGVGAMLAIDSHATRAMLLYASIR